MISAFESQIQSSNKHAEQYKQIAASCEEALKDSNEVFKLYLHLRILKGRKRWYFRKRHGGMHYNTLVF